MRRVARSSAALATVTLLAACTAGAPSLRLPRTAWSPQKQAAHLLNRLAYGPSPGDVESVVRQGAGAWIARQLEPAQIDDAAVDAKLARYKSLSMAIPELQKAYPRPMEGAAPDPERLPRQIERELVSAKLIRAVESRRQLQEVLADFWFNHFNVSAEKGVDRWMVGAYEREAIRPHLFGRFRDLLGATAAHPAMLFYLDNWTSAGEGLGARKAGLNENYARELLELHTLGVDGGYTQEDVREVARCFTGWSLERPRESARFLFRQRAHDRGRKVVLGTEIAAGGGREDGDKVLDLLARHPSTARFVARKLCVKLVSDDPPAALVERVAGVFLQTGGDLTAVYRAIVTSAEFWSDAAYAAKLKTPLELVASTLRAAGAGVEAGPYLQQALTGMGQPLYHCQPPTGYAESGEAWLGAGALVPRLNFLTEVARRQVPGVRFPEGTSVLADIRAAEFQKQ